MGTAQNRKIYGRHGVEGSVYGVSFANLGKVAKRLKVDHELALELWDSENFDARCLATMIVEPSRLGSRQLDAWLRGISNHALTDVFVKVAASSPLAHKKAESWRQRKNEWASRAGWMTVAALACRGQAEDEKWLAGLIPEIVAEIHGAKNRVKDAMNYALISIGGSHEKLSKKALTAADKIGKVEVDHGETGCKTRAARPYIETMLARKKKK